MRPFPRSTAAAGAAITLVAVPGQAPCGVAGHQYQLVHFPPVTTTGLRLLVTSRPGFSTGLIELMAFPPLP